MTRRVIALALKRGKDMFDVLLTLINGAVFTGKTSASFSFLSGELLIASESADYQGVLQSEEASGRIVLLTAPHIGNTGWLENGLPIKAQAVLLAHVEEAASCDGLTFSDALKAAGIPVVFHLDTRALTREAVNGGCPNLCLSMAAGDNVEIEKVRQNFSGKSNNNLFWGLEAEMARALPAKGKRTDLRKILIIGSGPIVIGQACEFDYSGVQATKMLKAQGYEVILVNSNPATIMTDPKLADKTYLEPLTPTYLEAVIAKERPQALLPTMGGQTALNLAMILAESGVLARYGVELIGADLETIKTAEDRELFRAAVTKAGLRVPKSAVVKSLEEARKLALEVGFPIIARPSFTLGGAGGGVAWNQEDLANIVDQGLSLSLNHEVLLEESVIGWKELELEVLCDHDGQMTVICSIENIDPMGVHTGDSITVAPAQTLTAEENKRLIEQSRAATKAMGLKNSGCNLQFALNPENGDFVIIEINPRVSRSSALASKATGVPIAKISSLLAVGFTLKEIELEMTGEAVGAINPAIDYVAVKIPRWNFEKFPGSQDELTTSMRSVGEVMALGRSFLEALQKGFRSLELSAKALLGDPQSPGLLGSHDRELLEKKLRVPNSVRLYYLTQALRLGWSVEEVCQKSQITPWFVRQIEGLVRLEDEIKSFDWSAAQKMSKGPEAEVCAQALRRFKSFGFSDAQLAFYAGFNEADIYRLRQNLGVRPSYKAVDACAGRVTAKSPYYYSTYQSDVNEAAPAKNECVIILGSGPNRIGQGLEFDYCCVHAAYALKEMGLEAVMINSNPETVSTDYDTATRLYFEPLTFEDVMAVIEVEKPKGVIVQFGGQTPLNLTKKLSDAGVPILGTTSDAIDQAEDRERFTSLIRDLGLFQPEHGNAKSPEEAVAIAARLGYPILVRPSYVLGGRDMRIIHEEKDLWAYAKKAERLSPDHPLLIDKFLDEALELDVDAVSDGWDTVIGGIIEQIEEGGIHSGDSAGLMPTVSLGSHQLEEVRRATRALARALKVVGLMNIQFAVKGRSVYVLEVNPRASRTAPFVSKATGQSLPGLATKIMLGQRLEDLGATEVEIPYVVVKEAVFSFDRFPGVDPVLGPEMRSTGEVMGISKNFGLALAKSQLASGMALPSSGLVFLSVRDDDKPQAFRVARLLSDLGFELLATPGTASFMAEHGLSVKSVLKVSTGRPNAIDYMKNNSLALVINTTMGRQTVLDSESIRRTAILCKVPMITTMAGATATAEALCELKNTPISVMALQDYYTDK